MELYLLGFHISFALLVVACYVTLWFVVSLVVKRNDIADIAWGPGIALVAVVALVVSVVPGTRLTIMSALAFFWGVRLALHVWVRHMKKPEDPRYARWRRDWGQWFLPRSYAQVYLLQGLLMVVVGYPFLHASIYTEVPLTVVDIAGVWLWIIGFVFEAVADYQLHTFASEPTNKGRILKTGLWQYSRHPNYFGELLQWYGLAVMVLALPFGALALVSPLVLTYLLLRVSGIPLLEAHMQHKPGYRAYALRTSALIPRKPKLPVLVRKKH